MKIKKYRSGLEPPRIRWFLTSEATRKSYPSDVSREQFSEIEPLLLSARKITAPRKLDLAVDSVLEAIDEKLNTPHPPRKARRSLPQGER